VYKSTFPIPVANPSHRSKNYCHSFCPKPHQALCPMALNVFPAPQSVLRKAPQMSPDFAEFFIYTLVLFYNL